MEVGFSGGGSAAEVAEGLAVVAGFTAAGSAAEVALAVAADFMAVASAGAVDFGGGGGFHEGGFGWGGFGGYHPGGLGGAAGFARRVAMAAYRGGVLRAAGPRGGYGGSLNRGQLNSFLGLPTDGGMHAAGGVYAHGQSAGRGIAAGPGGVAAGRYASAGRGFMAQGPGLLAHLLSRPGPGGPAMVRWPRAVRARWCEAHPGPGVPRDTPRRLGPRPPGHRRPGQAWALGSPGTPRPPITITATTSPTSTIPSTMARQPVATQQQYYEQAAWVADSGPDRRRCPVAAAGGLRSDRAGPETPDMVFQLAIDKAGAIRGNYYNQVSDATAAVTGATNKKDQRVAWRMAGNGAGHRDGPLQSDQRLLHGAGPPRARSDAAVRARPVQAAVGFRDGSEVSVAAVVCRRSVQRATPL